MNKKFCPYCGTKLDNGARFCKNCGESMVDDAQKTQESSINNTSSAKSSEENTSYEGSVHKCPCCGNILNAFTSKCPFCGYEVRNRAVVSSVRELTRKLEAIDAEQMKTPSMESSVEIPEAEELPKEPASLMKTLIGWDFHEHSRREFAEKVRTAKKLERDQVRKEQQENLLRDQQQFEQQKQMKKANLITNFPIPNTKEDILEFALLAYSNVNSSGFDSKNTTSHIVLKAWMNKLDQVYKKAQFSFAQDPDFEKVRDIYQQTQNQWKIINTRSYLTKTWSIAVTIISKAVFVIAGIILLLIAINIDKKGGNASLHELTGVILLIVSATKVVIRTGSLLDILIAACGGGLSMYLSKYLDNGSLLLLGGAAVLIIAAKGFTRLFTNKDEDD